MAENQQTTALWQSVLEANPWLRTLGVTVNQIRNLAATSSGTSELLSRLRDLDVVKRRTQAMYGENEERLFASEAELFRWEDEVRGVLRQAGVNVDRDYATPETLIGFSQARLSPDEIRTRAQAWKGVKEAAPRAREIFYVYAGLVPGDDDLFEALMDPGKAQNLANKFNAGVANTLSGPTAFRTWIDRARQAGNSRLVRIMEQGQRTGATYGTTIQRIINVDPNFANQIMETLYSGGDPDAGDFLDLTSMLDAYELMGVGAAAEGAGLELPTMDRLKEIRAAGIQRSQAIDAYSTFGMRKDALNAAVQRARGHAFGTTDFENAEFFSDVNARKALEQGEAYMQAAGRSQGTFAFNRGAGGQFVQSGLSAY